jgi:2-methylcitrate dehydratase
MTYKTLGAIMDRTRRPKTLDPLSEERRKFLKRVATAGAVLSMAALPGWAQATSEPKPTTQSTDGSVGQPGVSETLASYAINLKYEDIPKHVVHEIKRRLIDSIGCGIGGFSATPSQIANKLSTGVSAIRGATVMCSGVKTSLDLATFTNGVMIRYLDFNDGYTNLGDGHPSDTIAPMLAAAEIMGRNGQDLILSTVLSYEVFCRVCDVLDNAAIGMDYATMIGLATVAGTGRMLGLTRQQIVNAINIYIVGNVALEQTRHGTLSDWKACSQAEAAREAIFAVQLAQGGMTGPSQAFEGPVGFFNAIYHKTFALTEFGSAGQPFALMHSFMKYFPIGMYSQSVAQAAVEARSFFAKVDEIAQVNIKVSHAAIADMADSPVKWHPSNSETADHSMPYAAALALTYGTIERQYYEPRYLHNQTLLDLVSRVHIMPSDDADRLMEKMNLCDLEIVLKSGQRKNVRVEYPPGGWQNPMTDAQVEEKFRLLARQQLSSAQTDNLLRQLWTLDSLPQASALLEATRI